jgi:hypothetical protein
MKRAIATFALFGLLGLALFADPSCCVEHKAKGKACPHPCCEKAVRQKKTCSKCQIKPTCCDKAIAEGKDCEHKCCIEAAKKKQICETCNPKSVN